MCTAYGPGMKHREAEKVHAKGGKYCQSTISKYGQILGGVSLLLNTTTFPNEYYAILLVKIGAILFFCNLFKFYFGHSSIKS